MFRPPTSGTKRSVRASATSSSLPWIPPLHLFLRFQRLTPWFIVVPVVSCSNVFHMASITAEDCVYKAKWGMKEHVELLEERGLPVPPKVKDPKIIVQNEARLAA